MRHWTSCRRNDIPRYALTGIQVATNDSNEYEKITNFIFGERKIAGSFYENPKII